MEESFERALALLRPPLRRRAEALPAAERLCCEELRLRRGRPLTANLGGREFPLGTERVSREDLDYALEKACNASLHSVGPELRRGYIAVAGGLRLGLCGHGVAEGEAGLGLRDVSSLCLRIPRAHAGCGEELFEELWAVGLPSVLIVSPPGAGKTTLLRELIRRASERGLRVAVADERGELAGAGPGGFAFDVGPCTDVMTAMPKAAAALSLLRSMNPQLLAMDEISDPADARALGTALGCGVRLLATVHGRDEADLRARPALAALWEGGAFGALVRIGQQGGRRAFSWKKL